MGGRGKVLSEPAAGKRGLTGLQMTRNKSLTNKMEAINGVFGNPLLLDKIVEYSVYSYNDIQICHTRICHAIRLVNKKWLQSASRVLTTSTAFNRLESNTDTSFLGINYLNTKVINKFVSVFSEASRVDHSFLPLRLELKPHYFIQENHKTFKNLFDYCGNLMLVLAVNFPFNGGSMPLKFGELNLPNLSYLYFTFDGQKNIPSIQTNARVSKTNANGWNFLQEILQHGKKIKYFALEIEEKVDKKQAENIDSIKLPNSIIDFLFKWQPAGMQLKFLSTKKLPNLRKLILHLVEAADEEQIIFEILDNLKTQLKTFHLKTERVSFVPDYQFYIKFPQMEKLTTLKLFPVNLELMPRMEINWSTCVRNVTRLDLLNFGEALVSKWIHERLIFPNVKHVMIMLKENERKLKSPNERILEKIQNAFTNIQKLSLCFVFSDIASLTYLFQNLNYLEELHLIINGHSDNSTGYVLASTLLGISPEEAERIRNETDHNIHIPTDNPQSIMNMNELICLTLDTPETADCHNHTDFYAMKSCIKFGFEKMPQLKKFTLLGGFKDFHRDD